MTLKQAINYWRKSAQMNLSAAQDLFKTRHYVECLFFCHLSIEKIIKGLVLKNTKKNPPPVHHLPYLISLSGVKISEKQQGLIKRINEFNLRARYNDYKFRFYKIADKDFTEKYLKNVEELFRWLKKQL